MRYLLSNNSAPRENTIENINIVEKKKVNILVKIISFVMFLFSIVPLAGNTVTLAVLLNAKPEKASFTVLLSTIVSVVYIPIVLALYGGF